MRTRNRNYPHRRKPIACRLRHNEYIIRSAAKHCFNVIFSYSDNSKYTYGQEKLYKTKLETAYPDSLSLNIENNPVWMKCDIEDGVSSGVLYYNNPFEI